MGKKAEDALGWLLILGGAAAAFYFAFKKTAKKPGEAPEVSGNVGCDNCPAKTEKKSKTPVGTGAVRPEDMIPKNANFASDETSGAPSSSGETDRPNPFREKDPNPDGLPTGFSGSFDDDPEAADLDGVGNEGEEDLPAEEE